MGEFDRMLVPGETHMAQQASGFPSFCGHVDPSGTHRYLTKRRWSQLVQREFLQRLCGFLALVARVGANCLQMKARHAGDGLVCRPVDFGAMRVQSVLHITALHHFGQGDSEN
jgi:hypothetical protein